MDNPQMSRPQQPSASDVAKYLLEKKGTLTGFQLQKLLYYCQAWSLAVENKPLFLDEVRAYEHGPAVPSVSMQHQHLYYVHPSDISGDSNRLSETDRALIDVVLAAYDGMDGQQLENLTHSEDPWRLCFNQRTGVNSSAVISQELMHDYYAMLLTSSDEERQSHHVPSFNHPKMLYVTASDYDWLLDYLDEE